MKHKYIFLLVYSLLSLDIFFLKGLKASISLEDESPEAVDLSGLSIAWSQASSKNPIDSILLQKTRSHRVDFITNAIPSLLKIVRVGPPGTFEETQIPMPDPNAFKLRSIIETERDKAALLLGWAQMFDRRKYNNCQISENLRRAADSDYLGQKYKDQAALLSACMNSDDPTIEIRDDRAMQYFRQVIDSDVFNAKFSTPGLHISLAYFGVAYMRYQGRTSEISDDQAAGYFVEHAITNERIEERYRNYATFFLGRMFYLKRLANIKFDTVENYFEEAFKRGFRNTPDLSEKDFFRLMPELAKKPQHKRMAKVFGITEPENEESSDDVAVYGSNIDFLFFCRS